MVAVYHHHKVVLLDGINILAIEWALQQQKRQGNALLAKENRLFTKGDCEAIDLLIQGLTAASEAVSIGIGFDRG